jgi:4a-hydroxytetrahydrobiopterin dehydratase
MAKLALRHCTPIKKGTKPISVSIARSLIKQLNSGWSFNGEAQELEQEFHFKNFHETMSFVNAVAWIANTEDHHPDFEMGYNRCKIKLTTHVAGGLTVNDFICAAKIDALYSDTPEGTSAEKTQAILEPRPQTGSIPRPAAKAPELNMSEAEELLGVEIKAPAPEPKVLHDEDELRLDPENEPTLPHLQNPAKPSAPIVETVYEDEPAPPPAEPAEPTAPEEDKPPSNQFLKTVILPPGMQSVHKDKDEEATVIAQPELGPDFGDENIELSTPPDDADEVRTMIVPGFQVEHDLEEENPDMMKTMIIRPPLRNEDPLNNESDGDETLLIDPKSPGPNKR